MSAMGGGTGTPGFDWSSIGSGLQGGGALAQGVGAVGMALGIGKPSTPDLAGMEQFSMQQMQMQEQFARDMAQNSIQWRVSDAQKAGISPLVALGAPVFNPSVSGPPVDFGSARGSGADFSGLAKFGAGLGDLGKGINATEMQANQIAWQQAMMSKQLQQADADIGLKGAQAAYWSMKAKEPLMPMVGARTGGLAGQQGFTTADETFRDKANRTGSAQEIDPGYRWQRVDDFTMQKAPSDAMLASASPWNPEYLMWAAKNRLIDHSKGPSPELLPPGTVRWRNRGLGSWEATPYWPGENR